LGGRQTGPFDFFRQASSLEGGENLMPQQTTPQGSQTKLYVGNLPWSTTEEELANFFAQVGTVVSAVIITDRFTGRSRGFGFVEMGMRDLRFFFESSYLFFHSYRLDLLTLKALHADLYPNL